MPTEAIHLTKGAYARLHAPKREGESFSDVINRLAGKFTLLDLVGVLNERSGRRLRRAKRDFGKQLRRGLEAKAREVM